MRTAIVLLTRDLRASRVSTARGARLVSWSGDVAAETIALARDVAASAVFVAEDAFRGEPLVAAALSR